MSKMDRNLLEQTALIVANGDLQDLKWFSSRVAAATYIVAADGGAGHLHQLGVLPDVVIGDLDSVSAETKTWLSDGGVEIKSFSAEKDETDLELALIHVLENGWELIEIVAAGGGRVDQFLANVLLLAHPRWLESNVKIAEPHQSIWLFQTKTTIVGKTGDIVSLIPVGGDVKVRRTVGLKWELVDSCLAFGPARGVSNRMTDSVAMVELSSGVTICCHIDGGWHR